MLVPLVLPNPSTSLSPTKTPPAIGTVAEVIVGLSGWLIERLPDAVAAAPFSVKFALVATLLKVGAASSGVMLTVVVWTGLEPSEPLPSFTTQVTVRVWLEPLLVG